MVSLMRISSDVIKQKTAVANMNPEIAPGVPYQRSSIIKYSLPKAAITTSLKPRPKKFTPVISNKNMKSEHLSLISIRERANRNILVPKSTAPELYNQDLMRHPLSLLKDLMDDTSTFHKIKESQQMK